MLNPQWPTFVVPITIGYIGCRYRHTLHTLHTHMSGYSLHRLCSLQPGGARYSTCVQAVRDQLTIPSRIGRHMREKGAVVGSDTFLARTLISAVRLSGRVDRWEGARSKVGCRRYT